MLRTHSVFNFILILLSVLMLPSVPPFAYADISPDVVARGKQSTALVEIKSAKTYPPSSAAVYGLSTPPAQLRNRAVHCHPSRKVG